MDPDRWEKIEALYEAAAGVEPDRRSAFLAEQCAGDEALRQEVESLLFHGENAGDFLRAPAPVKPLEAGQRVGHYEIQEKLGEGGMGAVYRAHDSQLRRPVALKMLPPEFAADPERRQRLLREARAASALTHPNIVGVYEVGSDNGVDFIAMEFVEGKTLEEIIPAKGLPLAKALDYGAQIAAGLARAHAAGVIHRDLKPGNIMLTPDGLVKLLDFGLARRVRLEPGQPTTLTVEGEIAGTPAYMSPEQAEGKPLDARSDVFSFGLVLYRMLTGRQAFSGDSAASLMAAVLREEPPSLGSRVPRDVGKIVARCLHKDPDRRFQTMADIKVELDELREELEAGMPDSIAKHGERQAALWPRWRVVAILGALLLLAVIAVLMVWRMRRPLITANVLRTTIPLPAGLQLPRPGLSSLPLGPIRTEVALSPDSRLLVFSASPDGTVEKSRLYCRALDKTEPEALPGTEGAQAPFFSADGQWVAFWAKGRLQKLNLGGGIPAPLCNLYNPPLGADWSEEGKILLGTVNQGLAIVDANTGRVTDLTTPDFSAESSHRLPHRLPGGKAVLFTVMPHQSATRGSTDVLELTSGRRRKLLEDGIDARYAASGHLVFMREGTLMAVRFDPGRLEVQGWEFPVIGGIQHAVNSFDNGANSGAGQYSFSQTGALVYGSGGIWPDPICELLRVDRQGHAEVLKSAGKKTFFYPRVSPDGSRVAYSTRDRNWEIWVHDLVRGTNTRVPTGGEAVTQDWMPDGKRLVFRYSKAGNPSLFCMPGDGSGQMERLTPLSKGEPMQPSISTDGRLLAFMELNDIYLMRMDTREILPIVKTSYSERNPALSPDGRWLAYMSRQSGRYEIYVTPIPGPATPIPISPEGGISARWARSGRELFYWGPQATDGKRALMAVDVELRPDFRAGSPHALFEREVSRSEFLVNYDVAPDGRFLVAGPFEPVAPQEITQLTFILNWFEELKRQAPHR